MPLLTFQLFDFVNWVRFLGGSLIFRTHANDVSTNLYIVNFGDAISLPQWTPGPRSPVTACAAHEPEEALDVRVETVSLKSSFDFKKGVAQINIILKLKNLQKYLPEILIWASHAKFFDLGNQIRCLERKDEMQVSIEGEHYPSHGSVFCFHNECVLCWWATNKKPQKSKGFFSSAKDELWFMCYVTLSCGYWLRLGLTAWFECFNSLSNEWRDVHTYAMRF